MEDPHHRARVPKYPSGMLMLGWLILLILPPLLIVVLIVLPTLIVSLLMWLYSLQL